METVVSNSIPGCPGCRVLEARLLVLETQLRDLQDKLTRPPGKRPFEPLPPGPQKKPTGKKRGAQKGHGPHLKKRMPPERVATIIPYVPTQCEKCDTALSAVAGANDPEPTIHQVAELPSLLAVITEHQGHARTCSNPQCGHITHTRIPADAMANAFGPNLTATIAYLSGAHGMSKRGLEETVETLFGVPISLGTIANLEQETRAALDPAYEQARTHVAEAPVKNVDETGWKEAGKKRWLWAAATPKVALFLIHPRRSIDALKLMLGQLAGVLVSDRWKVYDHWDVDSRQLCWAHIARNWETLAEKGSAKTQALATQWQTIQHRVFERWHSFRGGGLTRSQLSDQLVPHVEALRAILDAGMRSHDTRLSRFCANLSPQFPLLWLFTEVEGVDPTNNHAERVQRRAVLWRKKSFGNQSPSGCRFVERILTVIQSLRLQKRNALEFLRETIAHHRHGLPTPALCS